MSLAALLHAHRVKLSLEDAHGLPHGHMTRIRGLLAQRLAERWLGGTPGIEIVRDLPPSRYGLRWDGVNLTVLLGGEPVHEFDMLARTPFGTYAVEVKAGLPVEKNVRRARIYASQLLGEACKYLLIADTARSFENNGYVRIGHGITDAEFRDVTYRHLHRRCVRTS